MASKLAKEARIQKLARHTPLPGAPSPKCGRVGQFATEKVWDQGADPVLQLVADRLSQTSAVPKFWPRRLERLIHAACYHQAL
jgi:hypothetical protein